MKSSKFYAERELAGEGKVLGNIHWVGTDYIKCGIERGIQIQISLFSAANGVHERNWSCPEY